MFDYISSFIWRKQSPHWFFLIADYQPYIVLFVSIRFIIVSWSQYKKEHSRILKHSLDNKEPPQFPKALLPKLWFYTAVFQTLAGIIARKWTISQISLLPLTFDRYLGNSISRAGLNDITRLLYYQMSKNHIAVNSEKEKEDTSPPAMRRERSLSRGRIPAVSAPIVKQKTSFWDSYPVVTISQLIHDFLHYPLMIAKHIVTIILGIVGICMVIWMVANGIQYAEDITQTATPMFFLRMFEVKQKLLSPIQIITVSIVVVILSAVGYHKFYVPNQYKHRKEMKPYADEFVAVTTETNERGCKCAPSNPPTTCRRCECQKNMRRCDDSCTCRGICRNIEGFEEGITEVVPMCQFRLQIMNTNNRQNNLNYVPLLKEFPHIIPFVGPMGTGKTTAISSILYNMRDFFKFGVCFTGTKERREFDFMDGYVYPNPDIAHITKYVANLKRICQLTGNPNIHPPNFMIINDLQGDMQRRGNSADFINLLTTLRGHNTWLFFVAQTFPGAVTTIRQSVKTALMFDCTDAAYLKYCYESFCYTYFPKMRDVQVALSEYSITKKSALLYINNPRTRKVEDNFYQFVPDVAPIKEIRPNPNLPSFNIPDWKFNLQPPPSAYDYEEAGAPAPMNPYHNLPQYEPLSGGSFGNQAGSINGRVKEERHERELGRQRRRGRERKFNPSVRNWNPAEFIDNEAVEDNAREEGTDDEGEADYVGRMSDMRRNERKEREEKKKSDEDDRGLHLSEDDEQ